MTPQIEMSARTRHPRPRLRELTTRARSGTLRLPPESPRFHYTYRGRGALYQLFQGMARGADSQVLVPAFHCSTVVDPIVHAGYRIGFYDVTEDLGIDIASLEAALTPRTTAVVVINYFGMESDLAELKASLADRRVALVEDCTHAFVKVGPLRLSGGRGDASVYSFWKTVACLVGGAYHLHSPALEGMPAHGTLPFVERLRDWKRLADAYAEGSPDTALGRAYDALERWRSSRVSASVQTDPSPSGPPPQYRYDESLAKARCPAFVRRILRCADIASIAEARRRNFLVYARHLRPGGDDFRAVFRELPPEVCPWAFPLIVRQRAHHDHRLEAAGVPVFVFGESPHRLLDASEGVFPVSRQLSAELLALPVHQDLSGADVERFCGIIEAHFGADGTERGT